MACLSLAAKMEECKVPLLTDFPVEDYNFEGKVIKRMELLVLNTLEWKISSITPLDYLYYFISKFCKQRSRNLVLRIIELIYATVQDIHFMNYRPSVITAAATLLAVDQNLTKQCLEFKLSTFSSGFLEIEDVFSCYNRMQEFDTGKIKLPHYILSPNLSPVRLKEADVFGNSSASSAVSNKRKRLKFNDSDQTYEMPDEKRSD